MKAEINEILESARTFFSTHDFRDTPILTAYVDVDPSNPENQRDRPAWLIELKNEAKRIEQGLDQEALKRLEKQEKWAETDAMVMEHLASRKPTGRTVVLFTDHEDFLGVDVQTRMDTRLYYGIPQLKHLLFALDQRKKYLVILFSGDEARLVEVFLSRTTDELNVVTEHEEMRRLGRKAKTLAKERRDAEYERRFARGMADEINAYFLGDPEFERIVFGGNAKQCHAVANALHPAVQKLVVGIEPIDFKLPDNEIAKMIKPIADRYEEEHDVAVVDGLVSAFNRGGPAVVERSGVESALSQGKVRTLVIPYPIASDAFDALVVDATVTGAQIEFVYGKGAEQFEKFGGIGALLHYS